DDPRRRAPDRTDGEFHLGPAWPEPGCGATGPPAPPAVLRSGRAARAALEPPRAPAGYPPGREPALGGDRTDRRGEGRLLPESLSHGVGGFRREPPNRKLVRPLRTDVSRPSDDRAHLQYGPRGGRRGFGPGPGAGSPGPISADGPAGIPRRLGLPRRTPEAAGSSNRARIARRLAARRRAAGGHTISPRRPELPPGPPHPP